MLRNAFVMGIAWFLVARMAPAADVPVRVYADRNHSSLTDLSQGVDAKDTPLPGVPVDLLSGQDTWTSGSGAEGSLLFSGISDGIYLIRPRIEGDPPVASRNLARHVAGLLANAEPAITYVALGDSTVVYGASRPYPVRLADKLKALFPLVQVRNLAHSGSTTWDWLPGQWAFEAARTAIAQADLVTISLGGNDLQALAELDFTDFAVALNAALELIDQTLANAAAIVAAIRGINPDADIVWTIYPNYARSQQWLQYVPAEYISLLQSGIEIACGMMREGLAKNEGLLLADVFEEWADEDINPYMYDPIHLNDLGAEAYSEVIFRSLGGVLLPQDDQRERLFGFVMEATADGADTQDAGSDVREDVASSEDPGGLDVRVVGPPQDVVDNLREDSERSEEADAASRTGADSGMLEDAGVVADTPGTDQSSAHDLALEDRVSPTGGTGSGCLMTSGPRSVGPVWTLGLFLWAILRVSASRQRTTRRWRMIRSGAVRPGRSGTSVL